MRTLARGFTLTEIMVVVIIIGLLAEMMVPAVIGWRSRFARRNLRVMRRD